MAELESRERAEANVQCTEGSHSTNVQLEHCQNSITESCISEQPVDLQCNESSVIDNCATRLNRCESAGIDTASTSAGLCDSDSAAETDRCGNILCAVSHSVDSALLDDHHSAASNMSDTARDVGLAIGSMEQATDSSSVQHYPADDCHESLVPGGVSQCTLSLCSDSYLLPDLGSGDILSTETESKPSIDTVHSVSEKEGACDNNASEQTEEFARNTNFDSHHDPIAVTNQNKSAVSSSESQHSDSTAVTSQSESTVSSSQSQHSNCTAVTNQSTSTVSSSQSEGTECSSTIVDTKSSERIGVRCILTASLSELNEPAEEIVTHIGSTHIHVTDELSIINGVVQPVESPVKIGV